MAKFNTLTASMLIAALSLTACGDDDNDSINQPNNPEIVNQQQNVNGVISDASGNPLANAEVKVGKRSITTDSSGKYSLSLDDAKSTAVVLVSKTGYLTMAREFKVVSKRAHSLNIALALDQVTTAFDTSAGIKDLLVSGAKVTIPANAIVNADGSTYTGTVDIAANYYNPDSVEGAQSFTQPFTGQNADGNEQTNLVTVGVIDVKLTDPATGAKLDLQDGSTATLVYPAVSTDQDLPSIPLWYYDEEQTIWVKDGIATRQTDGSYQGEVSHFTLWNLDIPLNDYYALLEGCVIDAKTKKPYIKNDFGGQVTGRGSFFSAGGADSEGKFSIKVPFNTPLTLSPIIYSVEFEQIQIPALAQNGTYQINGGKCIEIDAVTNDSDNGIDLNDDEIGGAFNELPLAPTPVTPTPSIPEVPFQPPATSNTAGLIGYSFDFDSDFGTVSGLENISLSTLSNTGNNSLKIVEKSLYTDEDYFGFESSDFFILTTMGISPAFRSTVTADNDLSIEQLNAVFSNNRYSQNLSNGYVSTGTYTDVSLAGQKVGDVFALENNDDYYNDIPDNVINTLNNLPSSLSVFSSGASCKKSVTGSVNVDYISLNYKLPNLTFEQAVAGFANSDFRRGTWAGIPWIYEVQNANVDGVQDSDDDDAPSAYVNYNNDVYAGSFIDRNYDALTEDEKDDCGLYNEAAKNQILSALRTAYPTL